MKRILAALAAGLWLAACQPVPMTTPPPLPLPENIAPARPDLQAGRLAPENAARNFISVLQRVEPVAEQMCRERSPRANLIS